MLRIVLVLFFYFFIGNADEVYHAVKGGVLDHSVGGTENGTDINVEVQFKKKLYMTHYAIGADINTNHDTSFFYGGLAWEDRFFDNLLIGLFFGLAVHNGELNKGSIDKRQLGTRVLFREAIDIGFYINKNTSISIMCDHHSNGDIGDKVNQGNDNCGVRLGYYF